MPVSLGFPRKIRAPRWPEGLRPWRAAVERFLEQLARSGGGNVQIDGAQSATTSADGSQIFRLPDPDDTAASLPLYVRPDGRVIAGTIGGVVPTIGGDPITDLPAPTLSISGSGAEVVVVTLTTVLSVDDSVYVNGFTSITSVVITVETSNPGDAGLKSTSGVFEFALASFYDGVKTGQMWIGSLNVEVCDDGTGTATGQLRITQA